MSDTSRLLFNVDDPGGSAVIDLRNELSWIRSGPSVLSVVVWHPIYLYVHLVQELIFSKIPLVPFLNVNKTSLIEMRLMEDIIKK